MLAPAIAALGILLCFVFWGDLGWGNNVQGLRFCHSVADVTLWLPLSVGCLPGICVENSMETREIRWIVASQGRHQEGWSEKTWETQNICDASSSITVADRKSGIFTWKFIGSGNGSTILLSPDVWKKYPYFFEGKKRNIIQFMIRILHLFLSIVSRLVTFAFVDTGITSYK